MRANYTLSLVGLGETTIRCHGRAADQTSDSVAIFLETRWYCISLYNQECI